jgi:L-alanine-DL-glutamate epimerase-like enolase superfamily enzyme
MQSTEANVNTNSRPSELKITDMRIVNLKGVPFRTTIIRIDTDQGISGYGEVRDGGSETYALMLKSRILGENPCNVDKLFRKIKQFGHHARQAGGVCGIEMALMDLAGKVYDVPAYQLAGGKFRDRILCYCDTPSEKSGIAMGKRLRERMNQGFGFLKMDVGIGLLRGIEGTLVSPPGMLQTSEIMHPFTGIQVTDKGIDLLCQYVAEVREEIGSEVPLAVDHFGHIGVESCIRLGKALDQFSLAWYEDMVPWQLTDQWKRLAESVDTPVCTGEDIYLKENFMPLFESRAIAVAHPDLASSGGILETKKIGDLAQEHGVAMALHMAMSPVAALAAVHCAAATENFMVLENHSVDEIDQWSQLVEGLPVPLIEDGHIAVPEGPGLGLTGINEEVLRDFVDSEGPGIFESTTIWDHERAHDRLWS